MSAPLINFLTEEYLGGYIKSGGSKVKLLMDKDGTGVTPVLKALCSAAAEQGYAAACVDAAAVAKINVFSNIYQAVVQELDLASLIGEYCRKVIKKIGYDPDDIPAERDFVIWACEKHQRVPERLRGEIQEQLERDLFRKRSINRSFAAVVLQLTASVLGATKKKLTEEDNRLLYSWLRGEGILLSELRRFHVFTRVDRYNARLMLRSMVEFARLAGKAGLFLAVDKLEVLLARKETGRLVYSKAARDEFFESVRLLIDGIDTLSFIMIVLGFQRELVDDEHKGIKSYEALWLRIQHEVAGQKVNLFRDFLDLDEQMTVAI